MIEGFLLLLNILRKFTTVTKIRKLFQLSLQQNLQFTHS